MNMNVTIKSPTTDVVGIINKSAKKRQDKRIIKSLAPGAGIRQGDIYIININDMTQIELFKKSTPVLVNIANYITTLKQSNDYQLVPGSTKGSRHFACGDIVVKTNPTNRSSVVGPIIEAKTSFVITHPEHAHFQLPAGKYIVCYQLNAQTKTRVKD